MSETRRAVIVHGYGARPEDHWFGWLAGRLEAEGFATAVPALPEPDAPEASAWLGAAGRAIGTPGPGSVIVAHSLGTLTTLRHLARLREPWRLDALVLVAGFLEPLPGLPDLDGYIEGGTDVSRIASRVGSLTVIRSDADSYVPTGHTDRLAERLGVTPVVVPGAGHFLGDDGVTTLPEAFDAAARRGR